MKILITGIAGSGKTSVIKELRSRGYTALDLDDCYVCTYVNKQTGKPAKYIEGAGREWIENHRWIVVTSKLVALLEALPKDEEVFIAGKIAKIQAEEMTDIFDITFLLQPHDSVIHDRLRTRTTNRDNFAKEEDERDSIVKNRHEFERACVESGALVLENHGTVQDLVEAILEQVRTKS